MNVYILIINLFLIFDEVPILCEKIRESFQVFLYYEYILNIFSIE